MISIVFRTTKKGNTTIILGDFNAKVGERKVGEYVGEYGLDDRNEHRDRLIELEEDFTGAQHIIRNHIDFVLMNRRY